MCCDLGSIQEDNYMAATKAGDRVIVTQREVTPEDVKSGLYYAYFGGLTGTVDRIYDDESACVDIDLESLTQAAQDRHHAMQEAEKKRWMDSLSQDVRSRLTPEQQQLKMSYKILLSKKDLEPFAGGKPPKKDTAEAKSKPAGSASPAKDAEQPKKEPPPEQEASAASEAPKRVSQAELDATEEAFLQSLKPKQE
jgi:hypothetical protein